jgi:hypothetical protein
MRDNGLDKKEGQAWIAYKNDFKTSIIQIVTDTLNTFYRSDVLLREELYRANMASSIAQDTMSTADDILEYCKAEAMLLKNRMALVKAEVEKFLRTKVTGEEVDA